MKMTKKLIASAAALLLTTAAFALDGKEVIQKVLDVEDPSFSQTLVVMELIEKNGQKDMRQVKEYGRSVNGLKCVVMDFVGPNTSKVKGTRFLLQENEGKKADDKFIYLPDLRTTRRVNTSDGSKAFVGTDASYDDLSTRDIDQDNHTLVAESEAKNGYADCWKVESISKDPNDSQYGKKIQWIDKKTLIPVYAELYDKKGKLEKVLTVEKLEVVTGATGKTYNTPMVNLMENVQTGHKTRLTIQQIILDKPLPAGVFTQNFLNTGKVTK